MVSVWDFMTGTTPAGNDTDITPVMMLNGYETGDVIDEWMLYSGGSGSSGASYNDPTTGTSTSGSSSTGSTASVATEIPYVAPVPPPPYEYTTVEIDYMTNRGWNTSARTVDPLVTQTYLEYFCSGGISGAALCVGPINVDGWPLQMFSHVMIIDILGVHIFENGVAVHDLCDQHYGDTTYRIYRHGDNTIVYTATYASGETFVYVSQTPLLVGTVFDAYVYGKLYMSGDLVTDAFFVDDPETYGTGLEVGTGEVSMAGTGDLRVDNGWMFLNGEGELLIGDQIVIGTGEVHMEGQGLLFLDGSAGSFGGVVTGWIEAQAWELTEETEDGGFTSGQDDDPSLEIWVDTDDDGVPDAPGGMYALGVAALFVTAEQYAYIPPEPEICWTFLNEIYASGIINTSSPGWVNPNVPVNVTAKAWDDLEGGATDGQDDDDSLEVPGGGSYALGTSEIWAKAFDDFYYRPGEYEVGMFFSRLQIMDGIRGDHELVILVDNNMMITGTITASRTLVQEWMEEAQITDTITVLGSYIAGHFENMLIDMATTGQITSPATNPYPDIDPPTPGDGTYVDTNGDGVDDVYVGDGGQLADTDGDGTGDTWVIDIITNVDTDGDGTQDTWTGGGQAEIDEDGTVGDDNYVIGGGEWVDTDGDLTDDIFVSPGGVHVDVDGDGTDDTWLTGGTYVDTDQNGTDDAWVTGGGVLTDPDGVGGADTWVTGGAINVDTDGDGVPDEWIGGEVVINVDNVVDGEDFVIGGGTAVDTDDDGVIDTIISTGGVHIDADGDNAEDTWLVGGVYVDTDNDGVDDTWITGGGVLTDPDGVGGPDTWQTGVGVYVDTDADGQPDTWVGGVATIDDTNIVLDLPGSQIQIDTTGDGTPDTWLTGGEYYDSDGDGVDDVWLTDGAVFVDTDNDGTDDTWVTGIGVKVDTDDDGVKDTWVYGTAIIDDDGAGTNENWIPVGGIPVDTDNDGNDDSYAIGISVQVDTNDDGVKDTWVTGTGVLPDDGDDDIVYGGGIPADTDGDGTDDAYTVPVIVHVDTTGDDVKDTWITGVAVITDYTTTQPIRPSLDSGRRVWVVNLENGAAVQYDDYGFNSFLERDGEYFGVTEDGIFSLSGDTDAGVPIEALVEFGKSDLESHQRKGITNVYTGAASDGKLLLRISVDDGQTYTYRARSSSQELKQHRFDTGKGLIGVYHHLELLNENGDDFDIESIHFEPIATRRKI